MTGMRAMFVADWVRPVFIHFAVEAGPLQEMIPFELDLVDGKAYVSLVAFTQARLRPSVGGRIAAWLSTPLSEHEFLNLRTYVRDGDRRAIFFLAEWIPNRLAAFIGPRTYGLPYRLGRLRYWGDVAEGRVFGDVRSREGRVRFIGHTDSEAYSEAPEGSLDHFLLERYTAFTSRGGLQRRFDVAHAPWSMKRIQIALPEATLLTTTLPWIGEAIPSLAHTSPGVRDVTISRPLRQTSARSSCTLWSQHEAERSGYVQSPR